MIIHVSRRAHSHEQYAGVTYKADAKAAQSGENWTRSLGCVYSCLIRGQEESVMTFRHFCDPLTDSGEAR